MGTEIFYHGSNSTFDRYDLSCNQKADSKGGFGVHLTSDVELALEYAKKKGKRVPEHLIYTMEVPQRTATSCLIDKFPVNPVIAEKASEKLAARFSDKILSDGTAFRKFIAKKLTDSTKVTLEGEKAASEFLSAIGVQFIQWEVQTKGISSTNITVFDSANVKIVAVEHVDGGNFYSIAKFIKKFYNQYWGVQKYDAGSTAAFSETASEWGVLGNFARTPLLVNGVTFESAEQLFQMMKFKDKEVLLNIRNGVTYKGKTCYNVKKTVKSYEKDYRREDWGQMVVDAIKFCLQTKYDQSRDFREALEKSKGKFIVEDQTSFSKTTADSWGAKLIDGQYVGPNVMGRLLMELRDEGKLEYKLPDDALDFVEFLKK